MFNLNRLIWFMIIIKIHTLLAAPSPQTSGSQNSDTHGEGKLVLAQVISRHGNRTIIDTYKTDPYQDAIYWPEGFGQLTKIGNETERAFGKWLRRRYEKLIGILGRDKVYIASGGDNRIIGSASASSQAFFPISSIFKNKTIHIIPKDEDYLLKPSFECRRFNELYALFQASPEVQAQLQEIAPFRQYVELNSQDKLEALLDFHKYYDSTFIESKRGLELPQWLQDVWPKAHEIFEHFAALAMQGFTSSVELKKMHAGFLLKKIIDQFQNFRANQGLLQNLEPQNRLRLWLLEAHDVTIVSIMNALGVFNKIHIPPFASSFHFEMYRQDNNEFYIQIFYRHDQSEDMPPIAIPNCGTQCPLDTFIALYQQILPNESQTYTSMCI